MDEVLLGLALLLSFIFGWNNSSFLIGNLRGSGALSLRAAASISVAGLVLGVLLEGPKMTGSLAGSMAFTTTGTVLLATSLASVLLAVALTLASLPVSFSVVIVGAFLGATVSSAISVDALRTLEVVGFWFVAPLATAAITFVIYNSLRRLVSGFGLLTVDLLNRSGSVFSALLVSYTLGANNIGLIYAGVGNGAAPATMVVLSLVAVAGVVTLGRGAVAGTVGDRMLVLSPQGVFSAFMGSSLVVWLGTQLAVPVSISQCLLGGMIGAAFTKKVTVLNSRLVGETLSSWVLAPVLSFVLAYGLRLAM